jgi:hypothetical protein
MTAAVQTPLTWIVAALVGRVFGVIEAFDSALVVIDDATS